MGLRWVLAGDSSTSDLFLPWAGIAYHYTNAEGLLGILSGRALWATSATMLNDSSELAYGAGVLREAFESWETPEGHDLAGVAALHKAVATLDDPSTLGQAFIVSASTTPHSLNQWAHYASGSGYAIGFRSTDLLVAERPSEEPAPGVGDDDMHGRVPLAAWKKVEYDPVRQQAIARGIFDQVAGRAPGPLSVTRTLAQAVSLMKHPAFAVEDEVRLVWWQNDNTKIRFRTRGTDILPYVRLSGMDPPDAKDATWHPSFFEGSAGRLAERIHLPIATVHTGPPSGPDELRRRASLESLVRSLGYTASIGHVAIPLR